MARILPFRALRPRPEAASRVASVPYDVVSTDEARALAAGNPDSFLHVNRPEIDLPEGSDPHGPTAHEQGRRALQDLEARGVMIRDEKPSLYLYQQSIGDHRQVGIVTCEPVADYVDGIIKKHEKTRPDKEIDRARHLRALQAHVGPVFSTFRPTSGLDALISGVVTAQTPLYDFVAPDGVAHTVWQVPDPAAFVAAFEEVPAVYIADGHHRAAAAARAHAEIVAEGGDAEPFSRFLTVLFPSDQVRILAYNRFVHDLGGRSEADFLATLGEIMTVEPDVAPTPGEAGSFSMFLGGRWYGLRAPAAARENPDVVARLDAAILQDQVLGPVLGIEDPRTADRISFIGGARGTEELERLVQARPGSVAFSLFPLSPDELLAVADAGRELPPKSTWFEPKLRSGLFVNAF